MHRVPHHEIDPQFLERWSPRAMNGEPLSVSELLRLFEAARWAPSSNNGQPWRFVYARAGTPDFERLAGLLTGNNPLWATRAGALVVVLSKLTFDNGNPNRTHSYDAGAAWMSLALQGSKMGLAVHGMAGFDRDRARIELGVPEDFAVEAMIAVGHPGKVEDLTEKDQAREQPSTRRPLSELVFEGTFS